MSRSIDRAIAGADQTIFLRGENWLWDRVAIKERDGTMKLSQLREDEIVVAPGIIYRKALTAPPPEGSRDGA